MTPQTLLQTLQQHPDAVDFSEVIAMIDASYHYTPTAFRNGDLYNAAGQNAGSCKILFFAQLQGLNEGETLACFGRYYRADVLQHPDGSDHQNIRNFMRYGWAGVRFEGEALQLR